MIIMIMMTVMQRVLSDNANIFSAVSDFPHCDANEWIIHVIMSDKWSCMVDELFVGVDEAVSLVYWSLESTQYIIVFSMCAVYVYIQCAQYISTYNVYNIAFC